MIAEALRGQTMGGRVLTMLKIVPEWARLFVWPAHLRAEYSPREFVASTSFGGAEATGLAIVVLVALTIWTTRRSAPTVAFGLSWMCIALFPVSNVVIPTGILLAERTLFCRAWASCWRLAARWRSRRVDGRTLRRAPERLPRRRWRSSRYWAWLAVWSDSACGEIRWR